MIGYNSSYWHVEYPIYLIHYNPENQIRAKFRIFAISTIRKNDLKDYFDYTIEGGFYIDGVAHKSRFFKTYNAAYNGLLKLLKDEYAENLTMIKSLKDSLPQRKDRNERVL